MTTLELLIALTITSLVGLGVAAMLSAAAYGSDGQRDLQRTIVARKVVQERLGATLRSARFVLDAGTDHLVLWLGDDDGSGVPDTAELVRIEFDADAGTLRELVPDTDALGNDAHDPDDDFGALTAGWRDTGDMIARAWARGVSGVRFDLDDAEPRSASLVGFRITLTDGLVSDTMATAFALRNG